jgi:hypothetical protein
MKIRFIQAALLSFAATALYAQTPSVVIDGPAPGANVSGTVTVSGWAIDNTTTVGTAIGSVVVMVDGVPVGNASMGISRPDVCAAFPGRAGCPNVGYAYTLNTSTLSAGTHSITVVGVDTDPIPDSGSATVQVQVGPSPTVMIDSPSAGSVVTGTINVSGWALDNSTAVGTAISSVQVSVDGVSVGNATYGNSRSDVCTVYPGRPNCPNVGYTFSLDTSTLAQGSHVITVSATDSDGNPDTGSASTTVTVTVQPSVMIDSITAGAAISGTVTIAGWAIDNTTGSGSAISTVQIQVDGATVGNAFYGTPRQDICTTYPGRVGCPNVGFTFQLDTTKLTVGTHTITALATDSNTTPLTGSWTINVNVISPPMVTIESPATGATVAGTITVSGWALDPTAATATAINSVQVSVDGGVPFAAFYGLSRPDICNNFPGRPGCPNVGFNYTLDTSLLGAGSHTITVSATDLSTPPLTSSTSVTVTVGAGHSFNLESPVSGSVVTGTVQISGWALAPMGTQVNSVKVYVDGLQAGLATYGVLRTDVCTAYPGSTGCPYVGFSFNLDTTNIPAGAHQITVVASIADGAPPLGSAVANITVTH